MFFAFYTLFSFSKENHRFSILCGVPFCSFLVLFSFSSLLFLNSVCFAFYIFFIIVHLIKLGQVTIFLLPFPVHKSLCVCLDKFAPTIFITFPTPIILTEECLEVAFFLMFNTQKLVQFSSKSYLTIHRKS